MVSFRLETGDAFHNVRVAAEEGVKFAKLRQGRQTQELFEQIRILARNERQEDWVHNLGKLKASPFRMKSGRTIKWESSDYLMEKVRDGGVALIKSGDMFNSLFKRFKKAGTFDLTLITDDWKAGIHQSSNLPFGAITRQTGRLPNRVFAFISTELRNQFSGRYAYGVMQAMRAQQGLQTSKKLYKKVAQRHFSNYQVGALKGRETRRRNADSSDGVREIFGGV